MVEAPCLFDPTAGECGYCDGLDVELQQEAIQARLEEFPKPENFQSLIEGEAERGANARRRAAQCHNQQRPY